MRDTIKDENYFTGCIKKKRSNIDEFANCLAKLEPDNTEGKWILSISLASGYKNLFKMSYSAGSLIDDLYDYFEQWLKYENEIYTNVDYSLYNLIDLFSIGVFYEDRKHEFSDYLLSIYNKMNSSELIIDMCMEYLGFKLEKCNKSRLRYINTLVESENKEETLKMVVEKEWYKAHKDAYWYDTHKEKVDVYYGYWCFDLGALARILKIDDTALKSQQYYPYDLVHHND